MEFEENDDDLMHIGILRKSGRYPWGSGKDSEQRGKSFTKMVEDLRAKGMSESEVAKGLKITTTELRATQSIVKTLNRAADESTARMLKEKGMSNVEIGKQMGGINESSVRSLLNPSASDRNAILFSTANVLKKELGEKNGYLDVGVGVENHMGITRQKLSTAVALLKDEGYGLMYVNVPQLGTGKMTKVKVLTTPDVTFSELTNNRENIKSVSKYSEDGGRTFLGIKTPQSVDLKRVAVRYAEQGGADKDGVIELRRGVPDLSLGNAKYAQVRIAVNGTHYLKGMAMYSDDIPAGHDMVFNTNKRDKGNKLAAMKEMKTEDGKPGSKIDAENPFGSTIRQMEYVGKDGKKHLSPMNIVGSRDPFDPENSTSGAEGGWAKWSKTLSSQMLSKQSPTLAKQQLDLTFAAKKEEFDEINSLTNPAVKKKLLASFADGADAAAVHLKAAGLPGTASHVILPINSLKDNEIYAPKYKQGEKVVLIRHPHGGIFEIPQLTVNNTNKEAKSVMQNALDAVGINSKVAARLSGADFDGDTVLVIPNKNNQIKHTDTLEALKNFDPQSAYPSYEGMKPMRSKQQQMGSISNLITDMSLQNAPHSEIARAVKHSMVVIDAEKHNLNYKQSELDNNIKELKKKYQGNGVSSNAGAATLISRASSELRVNERKARPAAEGGPIDKATGEKKYVYTGETYVNKNGKIVPRTFKSTKLAEAADARELLSGPNKVGTAMEVVYAAHSNKLKTLANAARKVEVNTPNAKYSQSANKVYKPEVDSLNAKLNIALKNAPIERHAQLLANANVTAKKQANPDYDKDQIKKIETQALAEARIRTGAKKNNIVITQSEWNAIQAGAISNNKLNKILDNTDIDHVRQLATPRERPVMNDALVSRAKTMLNRGYTQAQVAEALGVPASTLDSAIS